MDIIKSIEHEQLKSKIPVINIGDTIRVHVRVKEGNRERIQVFEGIVIKRQGGGTKETFTVRRISYGVGVEKTFLIHSPKVEKVEIKRAGKVRRAKLYYLRDRVGKSAKTKENIGGKIGIVDVEVPGTPAEDREEVTQTVEAIEVIEKAEETVSAKTEAVVEEKKIDEAAAEVQKVEEKPEQVVEEVVDTVKEEPVEVVLEKTPVKEESKEKDEKSEEPKAKETKPEDKK